MNSFLRFPVYSKFKSIGLMIISYNLPHLHKAKVKNTGDQETQSPYVKAALISTFV